ncbi:MAG: DUF4190 domain-containing protein [Clostridium sp.]
MEYYDDNNDNHTEIQSEDNTDNQSEGNRNEGNQNEGNQAQAPRPAKQVNNMAVVSMLCGIFGSLALCCCIAFPLSIILGVAAISLSILSRKGQPFTGYAITGLVFGILSLVLGVAEGFYMIAINYMLQDPNMAPVFDQILEQYNAMQTQ